MLPSRSLPSRSLPSRALTIIREYSRPLTRHDWRKSKPIITPYKLYCEYRRREMVRGRRIIILLDNIEQTDWFWAYNAIQMYGLERFYIKYFKEYGYDATNVENIDGVTQAIKKYKRWYNDWEIV